MEASSGVMLTFNIDIVPVRGLRFKLFHGLGYVRISRSSGLTRHTWVHRYHRGSGVWVALSKHHRLMHEAFEEEGA